MKYVKTFEDYKFDSKFQRSSDKFDDSDPAFTKHIHALIYDAMEQFGPIDPRIPAVDLATEKVVEFLTKNGYVTQNVLTSKDLGIL